jgi:hypothetical protein
MVTDEGVNWRLFPKVTFVVSATARWEQTPLVSKRHTSKRRTRLIFESIINMKVARTQRISREAAYFGERNQAGNGSPKSMISYQASVTVPNTVWAVKLFSPLLLGSRYL